MEYIEEDITLNELSQLIDSIPIDDRVKRKNGEVSTPFVLRKDMLDSIPSIFWTKPRKILEPCCGKGGFVIDIVRRFKLPYEDIFKNLWFGDINPDNVEITKQLLLRLSPLTNYNAFVGDTLKQKLEDFDAVIGNPPYNSPSGVGTGNTLWQAFVRKSIKALKPDGYLLFIHPPQWRKPCTPRSKNKDLYKLMAVDNQILELNITYDRREAFKVFKCSIRFDWYLLIKTPCFGPTTINNKSAVDLRKFEWLPHFDFELYNKLVRDINDDKVAFYPGKNCRINSFDISLTQRDEYIYPCLKATTTTGNTFIYCSHRNKSGFGVKKVMFGLTGIATVIIDMEGTYGVSCNAAYIEVKDLEEATNIKKAMLSVKFRRFMQSCLYGLYGIEPGIFLYLKKDFWKYFI